MRLEPKSKKRKSAIEPMEVDEVPCNANANGEQNNFGTNDLDHISDDEDGGIRLGDIYIPPAPKSALTLDPKCPRLIITAIKNVNFKSYAGVQILGPFHHSFTSIIGPNGSGKSNVIDSMMYVFGYRATKIRSKKVSYMIHSSSKFPNCNSTTVEVYFSQIIDQEDETFSFIPGTEIVVSRTAFKDNSSYYQLNGKRVQFKEINRLLRSHGIDLNHNRFLILQGEIEQIALMKPIADNENSFGMLEYLEDIIGTERYRIPEKKLVAKIDLLNDQRKEKLNRVRTAESEWKRYAEPCATAVTLVNRTNALVAMRHWVLQKYIHESRKVVAKEESVLAELKGAVKKIDEKLAKIHQELREKQATLKADSEKYNLLQKQKDEVNAKLKACNNNSLKVHEHTIQVNKKIKNAKQDIENEKGKLINLEQIPEKSQREIEECERLLERHNANKRLAEEQLQTSSTEYRARNQDLQEQHDTLCTHLRELERIVYEEIQNHSQAESELKGYLNTETKENDKLHKLKEDYAKAQRDLEEKTTTLNELKSTLPSQERELESLKTQLQNIKTEETSVTGKVRSLRGQLEESRQAMTAKRSRGRVLDSLMAEKRNGNLPGIFGRLGDLGGIDMKYDIAISTGCGSLDSIVTDNVDTATECLKYLKRNNIGTAYLISLNKLEHLKKHYQRKKVYPENVPRLFDLIRVKDERVLPAFYFALRETLVAKDLQQASRIGYGSPRYRVVTLKGQVIETSGTMAGGGEPIRGKMSSSVQQDTSEQEPVEANERKLAELEQKLSELRSEQARIEDAIMLLTQTTSDGNNLLRKLERDVTILTQEVPRLRNWIPEQERKVAAVKVDPAQKARLEEKKREAAEKLEIAKANFSKVETKAQEVDEKKKKALGKVTDIKKTIDDLQQKIKKIGNEMAKLKTAINVSRRNATKTKENITKTETDLREALTNLESLKNQKRALTAEASQLQKTLEELDEKIEEGANQFDGIKEEINKLQQKEDKWKSERIVAVNVVKKKQKSVQDYRAREPAFRRDLNELKFEDPGVDDIPDLIKPAPLKIYTPEELEDVNLDELRKQCDSLKASLGDKQPNLKDIQEYKAKESTYLNRVQDLEAITAERNRIRAFKDQISKKHLEEFNKGFSIITAKLKEMYRMITMGGDAELELVDSMNPFEYGVTFSVRPPSKSWKNITNLSGGEKTLSSLALVFALHYYKPSPLYVMDEIDAALDFKNVSIVANYIKNRTRNAQFIVISLRYNMFEVCNRLVGIYKIEDCTKSVCIDNVLPQEFIHNE